MAIPGGFDESHINAAQKFSAHLLKQCEREDPRTAMIALAMCIAFATKACGLRRGQAMELVESVDKALTNDAVIHAQEGMSRLILPY